MEILIDKDSNNTKNESISIKYNDINMEKKEKNEKNNNNINNHINDNPNKNKNQNLKHYNNIFGYLNEDKWNLVSNNNKKSYNNNNNFTFNVHINIRMFG